MCFARGRPKEARQSKEKTRKKDKETATTESFVKCWSVFVHLTKSSDLLQANA